MRVSNGPDRGAITLKGRLILSACLLLAAIVLGLGAGSAVYQSNRELFRSSDVIGRLLCGEGRRVDDAPSGSKGIRLICRDESGAEVGPRNNFVAIKIAVPFMILFAVPLQMLAWLVAWRAVRR